MTRALLLCLLLACALSLPRGARADNPDAGESEQDRCWTSDADDCRAEGC